MQGFRADPVRPLFWGLVFFSLLMFFIAWGSIGSLFIPPTSDQGVRFIDMPAPLLAMNAGFCALPILAGVLILAGVSGMMQAVPAVGPKFVWRVGSHYVTAVAVAGLIILVAIFLFIALLVAGILAITISFEPAVGLAIGVALSSIPIALGWYLMFLTGQALRTLSLGTERPALDGAIVGSGAFAALLIGAHVLATILLGSAALNPSATIPPRVPWAEAFSGTAGFAALLVLTAVARRVDRRFRAARTVAEPQAS